jgi:hypothetical protein
VPICAGIWKKKSVLVPVMMCTPAAHRMILVCASKMQATAEAGAAAPWGN